MLKSCTEKSDAWGPKCIHLGVNTWSWEPQNTSPCSAQLAILAVQVTSAWFIQTSQPPLVTWRRSSCWIWTWAAGWTRSVCWNLKRQSIVNWSLTQPWELMKQNIPPCSATLAVQGIVDPNRIQSLNVQINCSAFWQSIVDWSWNETRKVLVWLYTNPATKASLIKTITSYQHFKSWQSLAQFCGILPTFLSLEAHQGKIISYVTAIWKPQWDFQITVTAKKCFAFHSLYNFKRSPLNLIIITHLCYKTMLRVSQGSIWGKEQSTCTIVELCVKICQSCRILKRSRVREKVVWDEDCMQNPEKNDIL